MIYKINCCLLIIALIFLSINSIAQSSNNQYNEISLPHLMEKWQKGDPNMVIVDVRTPGEYHDSASRFRHLNLGRIKGTINLDENEVVDHPEMIKELDSYKQKDIYVICSHSYRSRVISKMLLENGYPHVNNVQGGMTEWFRLYDEMKPYRSSLYETDVPYSNISSSQLYDILQQKKDILLIGFLNPPRFFWDSSSASFAKYFPNFQKAQYLSFADSLRVLDLAKKANGKPIILFNVVGMGGAETAFWLHEKGIPNVSYLVGNEYGMYEYEMNEHPSDSWQGAWHFNSKVNFITPSNLCSEIAKDKNLKLIDTRHDSLFKKVNMGIKHDYTHLKNAINFPGYLTMSDFKKKFPDKKKTYAFMTNGTTPELELVAALANEGYRVQYVMGGYSRMEWYMNNVSGFACEEWFD